MTTFRASTVIKIGIATAVLSAILLFLIPSLLNGVVDPEGAQGQELWLAVGYVLRVIQELLPPLGVVLIGAGLVMLFIERTVLPRLPEAGAAREASDADAGTDADSRRH